MKKFGVISYVIYPFDVAVFIGHENDEVIKILNEMVELDEEETEAIKNVGDGRTAMLERGQTILILKKLRKNNAEDMRHLSHEVFHAVEFLMSKIGITLSRDSDEAYAYLIGYLTEEILKLCYNEPR